ncbi:XRE family transcriptional regulator [Mycetocola tolaasinivorans]|uniref:XRE family transcriptional regulator n=1 Tax=Mycetocola tolaasinivorans TaxID=76635 RepID=A0A3L7A5Y0_9MICO|nr:helix-turn-helix transcriptional regulator [Mycetocola tolaasinivorans]RLP75637.1 XRE family transcriptional regulator [Mycetocola tolaasinivorans]
MDSEEQLGALLQQWRIILDLPQELVAERAGISRATLVRLEQGRGARVSTLIAVMSVLGIDDRLIDAVNPLRTDLGQARAGQLNRRRVGRGPE